MRDGVGAPTISVLRPVVHDQAPPRPRLPFSRRPVPKRRVLQRQALHVPDVQPARRLARGAAIPRLKEKWPNSEFERDVTSLHDPCGVSVGGSRGPALVTRQVWIISSRLAQPLTSSSAPGPSKAHGPSGLACRCACLVPSPASPRTLQRPLRRAGGRQRSWRPQRCAASKVLPTALAALGSQC